MRSEDSQKARMGWRAAGTLGIVSGYNVIFVFENFLFRFSTDRPYDSSY
jgi:hypothetical protein